MLKQEDTLHIEMIKEMNTSAYSCLTLLYLPLIKEQAYNFYMTLVSFASKDIPVTNHRLLAMSTGLSMNAIEKARKTCEEFQLIRTYYNEEDHSYLYVIGLPLDSKRFFAHDVFGRLFIQTMGKEVVTFYKKQLKDQRIPKNNYKEISSTMNDAIKNNWNHENEDTFLDMQEEMNNLDMNLHIMFDEKEFLNNLSFLIFPKDQRTKKNLRSISEIATIFGINEKMMKKLINKGMKQPENVYDEERLRNACVRSTANYVSTTEDPFKLPPRRFLEYKQNGVKLNKSDVLLIEKLMKEYRLQPEVINYLFETCLQCCDQKFIGAYVEKAAAQWVRKKIDNVEDAKKQMEIEVSPNKKYNKNNKQAIVQTYEDNGDTLSEEERQKMMEEFNNLGGI